MISPWPPHGDGEAPHEDGEAPHGDGEKEKKSCRIFTRLWKYEGMGAARTPCEYEGLNPSSFIEFIKKVFFA